MNTTRGLCVEVRGGPDPYLIDVMLSDIQAYLSEHGLVAVPLEPTEAMINKGAEAIHDLSSQDYEGDAMAAYKAMIAAQGAGND